MKRILFLLIAVQFLSPAVYGSGLDKAYSLFYKGNNYYKKDNFSQAIGCYQDILASGFESGPLYYNLGNAYFRKGDLGKAILNYLRAEKLIPRDADLAANLGYAESFIQAKDFPKGKPKILSSAAGWFSLDEITLAVSVIYFIIGALIILMVLMPGFRRQALIMFWAAVPFLLAGIVVFSVKFSKGVLTVQAVVTGEDAQCRFEPFPDATAFFSLNQGQAVEVISREGSWVKIKRADGKKGWVKEDDLSFLSPNKPG